METAPSRKNTVLRRRSPLNVIQDFWWLADAWVSNSFWNLSRYYKVLVSYANRRPLKHSDSSETILVILWLSVNFLLTYFLFNWHFSENTEGMRQKEILLICWNHCWHIENKIQQVLETWRTQKLFLASNPLLPKIFVIWTTQIEISKLSTRSSGTTLEKDRPLFFFKTLLA